MIPSLSVDLSKSPYDRWHLTASQVEWANALIETTLAEIGGVEPYRGLIEQFAADHLDDSFTAELGHLATQCSRSYAELLTANLYYDFVKFLLGCTSFAVDTPNGPIHARNMDWFSEGNGLADFTTICRFEGDRPYQSVGWPGFAGVFSGLAPGRFTITMNAALSRDAQVAGRPIAVLIRETLETCPDFESAVQQLSSTTICSDCLLMVTGTRDGEMIVIERTPTRYAHRLPDCGFLVVTNDFRSLAQPRTGLESLIYATTCSRYAGAERQLKDDPPTTPNECFNILSDPDVRMNITVQQMVFSARTGDLHVRT